MGTCTCRSVSCHCSPKTITTSFLSYCLLACLLVSCSDMFDSLRPHQAPLSMEFSRQEYWSGCHALLQGIFPTQGSNPGLPHCRWIAYQLSYQGSPLSAIPQYKIKSLKDKKLMTCPFLTLISSCKFLSELYWLSIVWVQHGNIKQKTRTLRIWNIYFNILQAFQGWFTMFIY